MLFGQRYHRTRAVDAHSHQIHPGPAGLAHLTETCGTKWAALTASLKMDGDVERALYERSSVVRRFRSSVKPIPLHGQERARKGIHKHQGKRLTATIWLPFGIPPRFFHKTEGATIVIYFGTVDDRSQDRDIVYHRVT